MADAFSATVQASSNLAGRGAVAIVEVHSGEVSVGDSVVVNGREDSPVTVTAVEAFAADEPEDDVPAVRQVGLVLAGLDRADVPRGARVAAPGA